MNNAIDRRLARLECTQRATSGPSRSAIPMLAPEEFRAALATAPIGGEETGGVVVAVDAWVSSESAEAVAQARALLQAAYDLGWARLGFQSDPARYLDVALPEMFPSPRGPAVMEMVERLQAGGLPVIRYIIKPGRDGRLVPDGWRPET